MISTIWSMINNRSFHTWYGKLKSSKLFKIVEELQQGTVNSPTLFNIFTSHILNACNLNQNNDTYSIAYTDDLILYVADKYPHQIKNLLESLVNKINNLYARWNLRVSPSKYETIIFRKPARFVTKAKRINNNNCFIETFHPESRERIKIPTKDSVKYLGMQIDYLAKCHNHFDAQLVKARNSSRSLCRLFHNKTLSSRAKIICYQLLIRLLLTYSAPICWNIGANQMEKIRMFERSCLRTSLNMHRKKETDYKERISSRELYEPASISRIDTHRLKLTREYYSKSKLIDNDIIKDLATSKGNIVNKAHKGLLQPQDFTILDKLGLIRQFEHANPVLQKPSQKR